jgi:hypothetical protein
MNYFQSLRVWLGVATAATVLASCGHADVTTAEVAEDLRIDCGVRSENALGVRSALVETPHGRILALGDTGTAVAVDLSTGQKEPSKASHLARRSDVLVYSISGGATDSILVSTNNGDDWHTVADIQKVRALAIAPSGSMVAVVGASGLILVDIKSGKRTEFKDTPTTLDQIAFEGTDSIIGVVTESVVGVNEEFASQSNLRSLNTTTGEWRARTSLKADLDRWILAFSPLEDKAGKIAFIQVSGLGSGGEGDIQAVLGTIGEEPLSVTTVMQVPSSTVLVGLADGDLIAAAVDQAGTRYLGVVRESRLVPLGCGWRENPTTEGAY